MSSGLISPRSISGASRQKSTVSVREKSRTTSQSSCAKSFPMERPVHRPDDRILAHDEIALYLAVRHVGDGIHVRVVAR